MKKISSILALLLVISMFSFMALGSGSESSDANVSDDDVKISDTADDSDESKKMERVEVGKTLNAAGAKITYKSCELYTNYSEYLPPKDGNEIYILSFDVENTSDSDILVSSYDFECYADGVQCEQYYMDDEISANLSPGRKGTGVVAFEVPKGAESIEVEYEFDMWTDGKAIFVVK